MKANDKLLILLRQQFQESDEDLRRRLTSWYHFLCAWRGHYTWDTEIQPGNMTPEAAYRGFWQDLGVQAPTKSEAGNGRLFWKETFYHIQTIMSRLNEAFFAMKKPFLVRSPRVFWGQAPPDPLETLIKQTSLEGAEAYTNHCYRTFGDVGAHRSALLNACIFGVGATYHREASQNSAYPRAKVDEIKPWMLRSDPMGPHLCEGKYVILERHHTVAEAKSTWPEAEREIDALGNNDETSSADLDSARPRLKRRIVRTLEYHGYYDLSAISEADLLMDTQDVGRPRLCRLIMLAGPEGPSETILSADVEPYSHRQVPMQDYQFIRSPSEWGCAGIGFADLLQDGQEAVNTYVNLMLRQYGLSVLGAGLYDSQHAKELNRVLRRPFRPSEWRAANLGGKSIKDIMQRLEAPDLTPAHQKVLEYLRSQHPLLTGVTPMNSGVSTRTNSNTFGEVSMLQNESNARFRYIAENVDPLVSRSFQLYVNTSGDAIKGAYMSNPGTMLFWKDENGKFYAIAPETFDEPMEVVLRCGSQWIDDQQEMQEMYQLVEASMRIGVPALALEAMRKIAAQKGFDPDNLYPNPANMQQMQPGGPPMAVPLPQNLGA